MTLPFTKRARLALGAALVAVPAFGLAACTDLSVDPFSSVNPENFYQTDAEVLAALSPVYSQLRTTLWEYHNLSQVSSDETIVPTRGSDWADGGRWLEIHRQGWTPTLVDLNGAWVQSFTGIARANGIISDLGGIEVPNKDALVAEARALRAFYYYTLLDLFGNVPILAPAPGSDPSEFIVDPDNPPAQAPRAEVFEFIVSELEASRDALPVAGAGNGGRFSQGAVDAILANLYLNAPVFTGTVTAGGLQRGPARWADAEAAATRVINGPYELVQGVDDWFEMFSADNQDNPEHIFVVQHLAEQGFGMSFPNRGLHYNSFSGGAWNGFSTIAETYNEFEEDDPRIGIFAIGRAINYDTGEPIDNRSNEPLIFSLDFPGGVENTTEGGGVRIVKFPPDPELTAAINGNHGNDYPYFRLGEMYLIRAEARFEQGNAAGALDDVNTIRSRVDAEELDSVDRTAILNERLFELTYEARRRQDLIRADPSITTFGGGSGNLFTRAWSFKDASEPFRVLFPIPQQQIDASDGTLTQNAGY